MPKIAIFGIIACTLILIVFWIKCISLIVSGQYEGYLNYFYQPVGAFILLIVLSVTTFVILVIAYKGLLGKPEKPERLTTNQKRSERNFRWPSVKLPW